MALVELLSKDSRFGSLIAEKVAEQWEKTLKENAPFLIGQGSCRVVADSEADLEIRSYIAKAKESGKTRVDLLEIVYELGLPSDQIERVMEGLSKEGVKNESLC